MEIHNYKDYKAMSAACAESILNDLDTKPTSVMALATGNSPLGVYSQLSLKHQEKPQLFNRLRVIKLDEWGGIPLETANICESFLQEKCIKPLNISPDRYFSFGNHADTPEMECERVRAWLKANGPIDSCVLGIGKNGHLGFNEPGDTLLPHCHVAQLAKTSQQHSMVESLSKQLTYGITLGMADILQSKKIILLLTGEGKVDIIQKFMTQKITTQLPASLLWLHPNVHCFVDGSVLT